MSCFVDRGQAPSRVHGHSGGVVGQVATKQAAVDNPPTDDEIVEGACEQIANCGSLKRAAAWYGMSARGLWHLINSRAEYGQAYALARAARAQHHEARVNGVARSLKKISESNLDDEIRIKALTSEFKTRQWLAKVSDPHMFGDKQIIEGGGKPLQIEHSLSPNEHARRIAFMLMQASLQSKPGA